MAPITRTSAPRRPRRWAAAPAPALRYEYPEAPRQPPYLKLPVQAAREDRDRPAVGVIGGSGDQRIIGGEGEGFVERKGVIGFQNALRLVVESAVADQRSKAAGGEEIAVVPRERVDRPADADHVVGPAPFGALDRGAKRGAGVDIRERHDLVLAVVPAPAAEQSDVAGQGLLEIERVTVFDAPPARLRDVEVERRIVQRFAIASG